MNSTSNTNMPENDVVRGLSALTSTEVAPESDIHIEVLWAVNGDMLQFHEKNCPNLARTPRQHTAVGTNTEHIQRFEHKILDMCLGCFKGNLVVANEILDCWENNHVTTYVGRPVSHEEVYRMSLVERMEKALRLEKHVKHGWETWYLWLQNQPVAELKKAGKELYGWDDSEPLVLSYGNMNETIDEILAWLGEHQCHTYGTNGLIPASLTNTEPGMSTTLEGAVQVPVDKCFGKKHLQLLTQLDTKNVKIPGFKGQTLNHVKNLIELVHLCLGDEGETTEEPECQVEART